jgi:hypothetical protein
MICGPENRKFPGIREINSELGDVDLAYNQRGTKQAVITKFPSEDANSNGKIIREFSERNREIYLPCRETGWMV